jgi:hypothetical protein
MYPTHPVAPAICIAALACVACAAHVIPVPSPAFAPSAHALPGSVPVAIAIELMNPDIIGEHRDGTMDVHQYDYTSPVLRAGVEEHVAAAAQVFGLQAASSASLRLEGQVDLYVQTRGMFLGRGTSASAAGELVLSDGDGVIFARAMLGRAAVSDREDPTAAFLALDEALLDWFQALDARIRSSPAVARRLQGR